MKFDVTGKHSNLAALGAVFGQANQEAKPIQTAASYQEVWDQVWATCEAILGPDDCHRMLGYQPYLCPPPAQTLWSSPLLYLGAGLVLGLLVGKIL